MSNVVPAADDAAAALVYSVLRYASLVAFWAVRVVTFEIPRIALAALSYSGVITLEFNATKLAILLALFVFGASQWIKVKYLNRYSTLKEQPLPTDNGFSLHPNIAVEDAQNSTFNNYLDEFLSAIKVFGYLEKPVFHELARHLQTRRLVAGDTLSLETDPSFYIVVDGSVQSTADTRPVDEEDDDDQVPGLQLLNSVQSGGTLSSLFTILRLFTEDVKLKYEEEPEATANLNKRRNSTMSDFSLDEQVAEKHVRHSDSISSLNTITGDHLEETTPVATSPKSRNSSLKSTPNKTRTTRHPHERSSASLGTATSQGRRPYETIIARAQVDTTLAVIPAEAFRRLTVKFPNAAAHIVQVILTRLSRVTLLTSHKYLGLTKEIVRTEKAINELACYPLPDAFYAFGGMQRLRRRFIPDTSALDDDDVDYFSINPPSPVYGPAMGGPHARASEAPSDGVRMRYTAVTPGINLRSSARSSSAANMGLTKITTSPQVASPVQLPYPQGMFHFKDSAPNTPYARTSLPADFDLRASVMECISKAMGLVPSSVSVPNSVETSPQVFPADRDPSTSSQFKSSYASLSMLGTQSKDDESVVTSSSRAQVQPDLENQVQILYFAKGSTLVSEGQDRAGIFYVIDGHLDVWMSTNKQRDASVATARDRVDSNSSSDASSNKPDASKFRFSNDATNADEEKGKKRQLLFTVKPGGISGYLSALTGYGSYVDITAKTDVYVGFLPAQALERLTDSQPIVLLTLAKRLISLLSPLILHIDLALDWMQINAGQVIYREGEQSDSFYICIQGRLRAISEQASGGVKVRNEYGQGESVGELDCLTSSPRPSTLHAIRDTELVRMPAQLFNAIAIRHPSITVQMTRILATRVRSEANAKVRVANSAFGSETQQNYNLKTVAIIPVSHHIPITEFAERLSSALESIGAPAMYLNQATITRVMGRHAFSRMGKLKLASWLADTEQKYRIVLYVADSAVSSPWTQTCIRQADCILLLTHGAGSPDIGEYERLLISMKTTARKELVLLHPDRSIAAGSTRRFLKLRPWISNHHHVQMLGVPGHTQLSVFKEPAPVLVLKKMRQNVQTRLEKVVGAQRRQGGQSRDASADDHARLARWLCGKSIGLVLGGGGARGLAHVGTLQALSERNIPVDMVGGTSIGAFIGGLYAREADLYTTHGRAKRFSGRMSTLWRLATDLTYPIVSYTTGHEFNRGIFKSFYDLHIEDFWLPFYAVTTNITWSRMEVHRAGFAWRYIRASMSLAGLLPPLCDNGDMLLDGGYFDNLPGASSVFAVDVGSIDDTSPRNFGDSVSGFWVLFAKWWPWSEARNVPSLTEIQSRLTYVSSVKTLEEAKVTPGVFYMRQPVTNFGTMDFGKYNDISHVGYKFAQKCLDEWDQKNSLPTGFASEVCVNEHSGSKPVAGNRMRRASI